MPVEGGADVPFGWEGTSGTWILHIEDDAAFADLVADFLERENDAFDVETETDPAAAVDTLLGGDEEFDCVVCDFDLPGINGLEVLQRIRSEYPDLPFILFTGKGSEGIASEAISRGVTDYLQKGGGTDQYAVLANRIENSVAKFRAEHRAKRAFSAMETAHDGISILDEDGVIRYANSAYADLLGYDQEELLGAHWERLYQEGDVDEVYETLLPAARDGGWSGLTDYQHKDGQTITVEHTLSYTDDETLICTISGTDESGEGDRGGGGNGPA